MIIENFRDLKRGDHVTFLGSNGIEYRTLLLTRECLMGWIAIGSVGQQKGNLPVASDITQENDARYANMHRRLSLLIDEQLRKIINVLAGD
jgi:hypothetical protein